MAKFYERNRSKTALDKVTPSDIAYSVLVYESTREFWMSKIEMMKTCKTKEEERAFKKESLKAPRYHVASGTRIPSFRDGWTNAGREYYKELEGIFTRMTMSPDLRHNLAEHWGQYIKKYHNLCYDNGNMPVVGCDGEEERVDDDNDCCVSLPGDDEDEHAEMSSFRNANNDDDIDSHYQASDDEDESDTFPTTTGKRGRGQWEPV